MTALAAGAIAAAVEGRRSHSPADLLDEYREVTARSTAMRRASTRRAEEITEGPFGWKLPYDRLLSIRTFDVLAHEQDVRRSVGRPGTSASSSRNTPAAAPTNSRIWPRSITIATA